MCTRPLDSADKFSLLLEKAGANVINIPMIEIKPVENSALIDEKLKNINNYYGIIFTSSNAVKYFFERVKEHTITFDNNIFAVGIKTGNKVRELGYNVSLIPETYSSAELAKELGKSSPRDAKFLFPCGNIKMRTLIDGLNNIEELVVYNTLIPQKTKQTDELENMLGTGQIDCIAFFSPSAVTNFKKMYPDFVKYKTAIAVIGKTTLNRALESGFTANIIAKESTAESLSIEIINYFND